jgi:uncharacterized protein (TIGR00297 family)
MTYLAIQILLGFVLSAAIGVFACWRGSLTRSGVAGAVLTGTAMFGFGGLTPGLLLIAFFVTASALSHYRRRQKEAVAEKFSKGERRDLGQTLANGGLAALLSLALYAVPGAAPWLAAIVGALAAVNADTWATELGVLSRVPPRLITTLRAVEPGTSGGVSLLGTGAALAGGVLIGALAALLPHWGYAAGGLLLAGSLGGLAGSLFDSLLGATVQSIYYCDTCRKETERVVHTCGTRTRRLRGWAWLDNDWVNFIASAAGAAAGTLVYWVSG